MTNPPFIEDIYSDFHSLSPIKQEKTFALSCFDLGHWEAGPDWDTTDDEVSQMLRELVEELLEGGKWRRFQSEGGFGWLDDERYHGDMTNRLLADFIAEELSYNTSYERRGSGTDFDVEIFDRGVKICDIGIKRMATTKQVCDEIETHIDKCKDKSSAKDTLLVNYIPVTNKSAQRISDFLYGYIYMSEKAYNFFNENTNYISFVPAPISPNEGGEHPLRTTKRIIRTEIGLTQRT